MLADVADNYVERAKDFEQWVQWSRDTYSMTATSKKYHANLVEFSGQIERKVKLWLVELLRFAPPKMTFVEVLEHLAEHTEKGKFALSYWGKVGYRFGKTVFCQQVVDALWAAGYRDQLEESVPTYLKVADEDLTSVKITDKKRRE